MTVEITDAGSALYIPVKVKVMGVTHSASITLDRRISGGFIRLQYGGMKITAEVSLTEAQCQRIGRLFNGAQAIAE